MALVSVVLIFLNEERFLEEAVRSVCSQTLTDWELVLVDDGSTDRSTHIARALASSDQRITYIDHPGHENRGMAASRNYGAQHTSAPYLAFIDGDDVWFPEKLADQVQLLEAMPDVAMVNGALLYWWSWAPNAMAEDQHLLTGNFADRRIEPPEAAWQIYPLATSNGAGVDLLVRRNVFFEVQGFDERFRGLYEDQSFLIKVFMRYPIYISAQAWIYYRQHAESACAQTNLTNYIRARAQFLDHLKYDVERLDDTNVNAAFRRARRQVRYQRITAPAFDVIAAIRRQIPASVKRRVRHTMSMVSPGSG